MSQTYSKLTVRHEGAVSVFVGHITLTVSDAGNLLVYELGDDEKIRKITGWAAGTWSGFVSEIKETLQ